MVIVPQLVVGVDPVVVEPLEGRVQDVGAVVAVSEGRVRLPLGPELPDFEIRK